MGKRKKQGFTRRRGESGRAARGEVSFIASEGSADLLIEAEEAVAHGIDGVVLLDGLAGGFSQAGAEGGIVEEGGDFFGEGFGVAGGDEEAGEVVGDDLGDAADGGGDDGAGHGLGLEDDLRDAFVGVGGEDKDVEGGEDVGDVAAVAEEGDVVFPGFLRDLGGEFLAAGAVAGDDEMERAVGLFEQERGGVEEGGVAFPAAEDGDHADEGGVGREVEFGAESVPCSRIKFREVDAGGDAGDALGRDVEFPDEAIGDELAGGDDGVGERAEGDATPEFIGVIDLDVAGADEGASGEAGGEAGEPAVVGAVGVDEVDAVDEEPGGEADDLEREEGLVGAEGEEGDAGVLRAPGDGAARVRGECDPVAVGAHPLELDQDPCFLSAPAHG